MKDWQLYKVGVDVAYEKDYTVYTVAKSRRPFWWEKLLFWLKLKKPFEIKIVSIKTIKKPINY